MPIYSSSCNCNYLWITLIHIPCYILLWKEYSAFFTSPFLILCSYLINIRNLCMLIGTSLHWVPLTPSKCHPTFHLTMTLFNMESYVTSYIFHSDYLNIIVCVSFRNRLWYGITATLTTHLHHPMSPVQSFFAVLESMDRGRTHKVRDKSQIHEETQILSKLRFKLKKVKLKRPNFWNSEK